MGDTSGTEEYTLPGTRSSAAVKAGVEAYFKNNIKKRFAGHLHRKTTKISSRAKIVVSFGVLPNGRIADGIISKSMFAFLGADQVDAVWKALTDTNNNYIVAKDKDKGRITNAINTIKENNFHLKLDQGKELNRTNLQKIYNILMDYQDMRITIDQTLPHKKKMQQLLNQIKTNLKFDAISPQGKVLIFTSTLFLPEGLGYNPIKSY